MRHCRGMLMLATAVLVAFAGLTVAQVQERTTEQRPGTTADRDTALRPTSFEGKITSVDGKRHEVVLDAVRPVPGDRGTGASAPTAPPSPPSGRPVPPPPPPPPPDDREASDRPAETGVKPMPMTFQVGDRATISLDGKAAELGDLKSGMWARIHVRPAERTGTGTDSGTRPTERGSGTDSGTRPPAGLTERLGGSGGNTGQEQNNQGKAQPPRDRVPPAPPVSGSTTGERSTTITSGPERGRPWVANRIEAFTKAPGSRP